MKKTNIPQCLPECGNDDGNEERDPEVVHVTSLGLPGGSDALAMNERETDSSWDELIGSREI